MRLSLKLVDPPGRFVPSIARIDLPGPRIVKSFCMTKISPVLSDTLLSTQFVRPLRSTVSPDTVVTAPMTSRSEPAPESLQLVTGQTLGDANAVGADSASNDAMPAQSGRWRDRILEARLIRFMELPSRAKGRFRPHCW